MNNSELIQTFERCYNNLLYIGVPLPVDSIDRQLHLTHKTSYFGVCLRTKVNGKRLYVIGINKNFAQFGDSKGIINTLYHELLHTFIKGHGKQFKDWATYVNTKLGVNVQRYGTEANYCDYKLLKK